MDFAPALNPGNFFHRCREKLCDSVLASGGKQRFVHTESAAGCPTSRVLDFRFSYCCVGLLRDGSPAWASFYRAGVVQ